MKQNLRKLKVGDRIAEHSRREVLAVAPVGLYVGLRKSGMVDWGYGVDLVRFSDAG